MDAALFFTIENKKLTVLERYQKSMSFQGQIVFDDDVYYRSEGILAFKKVERPEWLNEKSSNIFSGNEKTTLLMLDDFLEKMRYELVSGEFGMVSDFIALLTGSTWEVVFLDGCDRAENIGESGIEELQTILINCILGQDRKGFVLFKTKVA